VRTKFNIYVFIINYTYDTINNKYFIQLVSLYTTHILKTCHDMQDKPGNA